MCPAVETAGESLRLFAHQGAEQLAGHFRLLGSKALNVDLKIMDFFVKTRTLEYGSEDCLKIRC